MSIFLLSKTDHLRSDVHQRLREEISRRGNKVAYISSEPQTGDRLYYRSTIDDYTQINPEVVVDYFDLSPNFSDDVLAALPQYGTIYLSGGNTYAFTDSANKRNVKPILEQHLAQGGLLIGASAGAIMMTPRIDLAGLADENNVGLMGTTAFGFVDFEFHPHFTDADREVLARYMEGNDREVYICEDGGGLLYADGAIALLSGAEKWEG